MRRLALTALLAATTFATPIAAQNAGSYLAGRQAISENDYAAAADYYTRALARDNGNISLMENAITAWVGLGDLDRAVPIARRLLQAGDDGQLAALVLLGDAAKREDWTRILEDLEAGQTVGPLFDGLLEAWTLAGDGQMAEALDKFDEVASNDGVAAFGLYHKALALGSVGDFEGAAEIFSGDTGTTIRLTRRGVVAYTQVLSQLERNEDAVELIDATFGSSLDPALGQLRADLESGASVPFTAIETAVDGVAEIYYSIANALVGEAQPSYTLLYGRLVEALRPEHVDGLLLTAEILESLGRYDLATDVYDTVPRDDALFHLAELGRADALRQAGRVDTAIEVLEQLTESHGDLPIVHVTLGDTLRGLERYADSIPAYNSALALVPEPEAQHWIIFFARGISHERTGNWEATKVDFRKALELNVDQPQVLNYLGYSMLEKGEDFSEALSLIERAVEQRPDSGYITDSLGWGLYRLGRYDEAVAPMERAVELMPIDPIVNDHLGDVYWAVGREREAEFQWHRALSFITEDTNTDDVDPDRIRRKLEIGLDRVLEEEGAPPLAVANDDG